MQSQNPELAYEAHKKSLSIQEHGRVSSSSSINQQRHWINTITRSHTHAGTYIDKFIVVLSIVGQSQVDQQRPS